MSLHTDLIAGMRANLTPEVGARPPEGTPLGYGRDAWCTSSVTDDWREVDPDSPLGIAQTLMRACTTPRDTCPDAPGRGFDVKRALSKGTTRDDLLSYEGQAQSEADQDDRIAECEIKLTLDNSNAIPSVRLQFKITPRKADEVPFAGVIVVPETGAAMLEMLGA